MSKINLRLVLNGIQAFEGKFGRKPSIIKLRQDVWVYLENNLPIRQKNKYCSLYGIKIEKLPLIDDEVQPEYILIE